VFGEHHHVYHFCGSLVALCQKPHAIEILFGIRRTQWYAFFVSSTYILFGRIMVKVLRENQARLSNPNGERSLHGPGLVR
jgi:hypothetical protein